MKPPWLRKRISLDDQWLSVKGIMDGLALHTVCEEARCPNTSECWARRTATFMILGDTCTRSCGFCAVKTGRPRPIDPLEPHHVAEAAARLALRHVVVTSVNRDELSDGGAGQFARTIVEIRKRLPGARVEVLIPDFKGSLEALQIVLDARPDVLNHNVETVPRLYRPARPQANYRQSVELLARARRLAPELTTKSGIMVGLGETEEEVVQVMRDLRASDCDILTIGQYLRPTMTNLPVVEYVPPARFVRYEQLGRDLGFRFVLSGPFVRSSYHAGEVFYGVMCEA